MPRLECWVKNFQFNLREIFIEQQKEIHIGHLLMLTRLWHSWWRRDLLLVRVAISFWRLRKAKRKMSLWSTRVNMRAASLISIMFSSYIVFLSHSVCAWGGEKNLLTNGRRRNEIFISYHMTEQCFACITTIYI